MSGKFIFDIILDYLVPQQSSSGISVQFTRRVLDIFKRIYSWPKDSILRLFRELVSNDTETQLNGRIVPRLLEFLEHYDRNPQEPGLSVLNDAWDILELSLNHLDHQVQLVGHQIQLQLVCKSASLSRIRATTRVLALATSRPISNRTERNLCAIPQLGINIPVKDISEKTSVG